MLRTRRTERAEPNSELGKAETKSSNTRPWGAFSISKFVSDCQRFYSRSQGKHGTTRPVEQPASEQPLAMVARFFIRRRGETGGLYFRCNRLFTANHSWYFATREGENKGPFKHRKQAELALAVFIARRMSEGTSHSVSAKTGDCNEELDEMVEEAQDLIQIMQKRGITRASVWMYHRVRALKGTDHKTQHPLRRIEVIEHLLNSG